MSKTGGSQQGTIRFKEELAHGANAGLDYPIVWLEPIYKKYNMNTDLSYADLYTLAGVVAIQQLGGPTIGWRAGRVDALDPSAVTPDGRLPDADKVFYDYFVPSPLCLYIIVILPLKCQYLLLFLFQLYNKHRIISVL